MAIYYFQISFQLKKAIQKAYRFVSVSVIFGIVAVAVLADKYLDIHYLATGVLVSNDSIYTVKVAYLLPTLIIGMVMGIISLILAILVLVKKGKKTQK